MASEVYIVTGASRGIGLELVRQLLSAGQRVIAGARKPSLELKALAESGDLKILDLDVTSDSSVARFFESVKAIVDRVDVLINNAGIYLSDDGPAASVAITKVAETLNTNTLGPIRVTQTLLPLLKKSKRARVVNITSLMGSIADNGSGNSLAYRMSKTALNMFSKTLAVDEKDLTVLSLHPGWVQTSMGGERAPLQASASAEGLLKVIAGASHADSGKFLTYSGRELPW